MDQVAAAPTRIRRWRARGPCERPDEAARKNSRWMQERMGGAMNERTGMGGLSRRSFLRTAGPSVAALGAGRVLPPLGPPLAHAAHPADPRARKGGTLVVAGETEPNPVDPQR